MCYFTRRYVWLVASSSRTGPADFFWAGLGRTVTRKLTQGISRSEQGRRRLDALAHYFTLQTGYWAQQLNYQAL